MYALYGFITLYRVSVSFCLTMLVNTTESKAQCNDKMKRLDSIPHDEILTPPGTFSVLQLRVRV